MKFVWIDPGSFRMGSDDKDADEKPAHTVTLSKGFYLQTTEVTQRQWEAVMGTNPSHFKGPDRPVEMVSWRDAQEFLKKLNAKEKDSRYRLPSEAEWEYACRAGGQEPDEAANLDEVAWWLMNSNRETHPVGQKKPNAWGLFDMRGNVWEWVEDWYGWDTYAKSRQLDPAGPGSGFFWVLRGGSWRFANTVDFRCARRGCRGPGFRVSYVGFRCARTF
jgi:formylglycine-generating enzyme required for sulfatase activity